MNCPHCDAPAMRTIESFTTSDETVRTKLCRYCKWKYRTREMFTDDIVIPASVRRRKPKPEPTPQT